MTDSQPVKRRWITVFMGTGIGILIGFVVGVLLTACIWWCWSGIIREESLNPLADLNIEKERLSDDESCSS